MATPLLGGLLIGLAGALLLLGSGRVAGISGILAGAVWPGAGVRNWRVYFLVGLLGAGALLAAFRPELFGAPVRSGAALAAAGVLVGFGSRLGGGCTSGHGVCGTSRLSVRSIVATVTFIGTGIGTVLVTRWWS